MTEYRQLNVNGQKVIIISGGGMLFHGERSALDIISYACFENECNLLAVHKDSIAEDFFKLSTGIAGAVLQKFTNYSLKLAIIGDFSTYASKPLADFIYECSKGGCIFFVEGEEEAVNKLCGT